MARRRAGDLLDRDAEVLGDLVEALALEHRQVVAHDAIGERVLLAAGAQLQAQAFAQVAGADARRIELLDAPQRALDDLEVLAALEGDLLDGELDVAVVVHVADQHGGDRLLLLVELVHLQLPEEVVGERLAAHQRVLDARPLLVVEVAAGGAAMSCRSFSWLRK